MSVWSDLIEACRDVAERAAQTLDWWTNYFTNASPLTIALDQVTLGRAALYEALLESPDSHLPKAVSEINAAVDGLRRAGNMAYLPSGLLTRARLRCLEGTLTGPDSAQEDLDEAWEIAERGPMRLFLADIHLYRARLFGNAKRIGGSGYPWNKNADGSMRGPKDDLAAARKLIEQCGYWRRREEMEDAEAIIK